MDMREMWATPILALAVRKFCEAFSETDSKRDWNQLRLKRLGRDIDISSLEVDSVSRFAYLEGHTNPTVNSQSVGRVGGYRLVVCNCARRALKSPP